MSWLKDLEHVVRTDEPLAPYTWLGIGGTAEFFACPTTVAELGLILKRCHEEGRPVRLLGGGSNLLVSDRGVVGTVLQLQAPVFCGINVAGSRIRAGGGGSLGLVVSSSIREGLAGLESFMGIPGTVGGAVVGNAGDRTADVASCLEEVVFMTLGGELTQRRREDIPFAYRESNLNELVILEAIFGLEPDDPQELTRRMQKLWIVRRSREPTRDKRTACLFRDSQGTTASELIEQSGLKGTMVGGASLYERDLNFLTAASEATADDVLRLIEIVRDRVSLRTGTDLEPSIQIW